NLPGPAGEHQFHASTSGAGNLTQSSGPEFSARSGHQFHPHFDRPDNPFATMTGEPIVREVRAMSLITLTTDFGSASPYVAAMKGVHLSVNPAAAIHDLSHAIPPQDVKHAAQFLAGSVPFFPPKTIHVCVVDPGVGSDRAILLAEAGAQLLLAPDNGCLTE